MTRPGPPEVLTSGEVAQMLRVTAVTVARWADTGRLTSFRTPGGHRRFLRAEVEAYLVPETVGTAATALDPPHPGPGHAAHTPRDATATPVGEPDAARTTGAPSGMDTVWSTLEH
ncbi:DNA binding domain-containing protein, excisionase family [Nocardiopsis flavescens]|uniref:DNA binding domain-containing protein, excisionase family n=1 Tax=Nocardiopsis flavescens TaxID=758803 RepID=A0A1M6BAD7_9ACTN|nr:DNA binding domain-containing protein, excisionase family [Nocardiopsis flavescens]